MPATNEEVIQKAIDFLYRFETLMDEFDAFLGSLTKKQLQEIMPSIKAADAAIKRDRRPDELRFLVSNGQTYH